MVGLRFARHTKSFGCIPAWLSLRWISCRKCKRPRRPRGPRPRGPRELVVDRESYSEWITHKSVGFFYHSLSTGWWFQTFFIFHNIWDNPSHWLIFFRGVETTNQSIIWYPFENSKRIWCWNGGWWEYDGCTTNQLLVLSQPNRMENGPWKQMIYLLETVEKLCLLLVYKPIMLVKQWWTIPNFTINRWYVYHSQSWVVKMTLFYTHWTPIKPRYMSYPLVN